MSSISGLWAPPPPPNFFLGNGEAQRGFPKRQKKCHIEKKSPHKENRVAKGSYMEKNSPPPLLRKKRSKMSPYRFFSRGAITNSYLLPSGARHALGYNITYSNLFDKHCCSYMLMIN